MLKNLIPYLAVRQTPLRCGEIHVQMNSFLALAASALAVARATKVSALYSQFHEVEKSNYIFSHLQNTFALWDLC